jgi:hypothetical protein
MITAAPPSVPVETKQLAQKGVVPMAKFNFLGMGPNALSAIALIWALMTTPVFLNGTEGEGCGLP